MAECDSKPQTKKSLNTENAIIQHQFVKIFKNKQECERLKSRLHVGQDINE